MSKRLTILETWSARQEARVYLRAAYWWGVSASEFAKHVGITYPAALRVINRGAPIGDKTIARLMTMHPGMFDEMFEVKLDHGTYGDDGPAFVIPTANLPTSFRVAVDEGLVPQERTVQIPFTHVIIRNGRRDVMAFIQGNDDAIYVLPEGKDDPDVHQVVRDRFNIEPNEYPRGGVLTPETIAAAKRRIQREKDMKDD